MEQTRNIKIILSTILIGTGFLFAGVMPEQSDDTFMFCLKPSTKPLEILQSYNQPKVDNSAVQQFLDEHNAVKIEAWIPQADPRDHDGDVYLNRIYRVYLSDKDRVQISIAKDGITTLSSVLSSEYDYIRKPTYVPNDPMVGQQCSLGAVKAFEAWDFFVENGQIPGDRHVLLASVDTGVDYTHPDLQNNIWINQGEVPSSIFSTVDSDGNGYVNAEEVVSYLVANNMDYYSGDGINLRDALQPASPFTNNSDDDGDNYVDDLIGWDASGYSGADDNDPMPKAGVPNNSTWAHGTHVAGILSAVTDNNLGMASTAFRCSVIPVKCSRENQGTEPYVNDGYPGMYYAARAGYYAGTFTIINNSWGGGGFSSYEQNQVNTAHNTYGAVIVAAAGNGQDYPNYGEEYGSHYPSSYDNVISVAAMGCNGVWGHWATYHESVDLSAPGEGITSLIIGTGYESWDGSSMASPNAASCIGLLKAFYPEWDNETLETRIVETADPLIYLLNTEDYLQNRLGSGMVDVYKAIGATIYPNITYVSHTLILGEGDGDNVLNPGETTQLRVTIENEEGWVDAINVSATLSCSNPNVTITDNSAQYPGIIYAGGVGINLTDPFEFELSDAVDLGEIEFQLSITANSGQEHEYSKTIAFQISVSLNQDGWPFVVGNQVWSSPVVVDINNDGSNEIIFSDYSGIVRIMTTSGEELSNFDTGDQIWGSPAVADVDNDGALEIVVASKSRHVFVLDQNCSVETDYDAGQYLMGTPALGDIDGDGNLEIVVGGYSSPGKIFAINPDGTDVPGFPYELGEKIQRGVALADFNGNGKVDIVCGTDGESLWLIYDDLTVADGFPFTVSSDFRTAPSIVDVDGEKIIFAGSRNDNFYAVNSNGELRFEIASNDDMSTSPGFVETPEGIAVFIGSEDGTLFGVDLNGNALPGWPKTLNGDVIASPVFADLDGDGSPEVISATADGNLYAYKLNGEMYAHFPIQNTFPFKGSPTIFDTDNDGDLEIMIGTSASLENIDVKESGSVFGFWNMYRGNLKRTGFYSTTTGGPTSVNVDHLSGWNLVGLPMNTENTHYQSLFPDALEGTLFSFDGGFIQEEQLSAGIGYYLRFPSDGVNTITGTAISSVTVSLAEGWNLFTGVTAPVSVDLIHDPYGIIIDGTIYEFNGGYEPAEILSPGKGYWIRTSGEGNITITSE